MVPTESVDPRIELGRRLKERRLAKKLNVSGVAMAARNLDESNIRKIEAGSNPTIEKVLRLAGALEFDLGELFCGLDPYALPEDKRPTAASEIDPSLWRPNDLLA